ncbi:hypothetical protein QBC34DRAFT_132183 [Podospora aff. communis PSN243]|uniref:FAD-binding domain-containing protein n=1 Tax=Podospora aff. communis PSN243 TaxID=3040156 RepID=A0AAV9GIX6_9PEZI|nr:hypothetical protein QBC34DRAFT_132183 [Podospora aff. communis PSN243]
MTENQGDPLPRIAIVGAGVCGLVLAQGLKKHGFQVTVYEREAHIGERAWEWTLILHWALPTLRNMLPGDVLADQPSAHANPLYPYGDEPETLPFYNSMTGDVALRMTAPFRRMSRRRLHEVCSKGLDIRWGTRVVDLKMEKSGPVSLSLENGRVAKADLVIGADGSSSRIRQWLVGEEAGRSTATDWTIGSGIIRYDADQAKALLALSEICSVSTGPSGMIVVAVSDFENAQDASTCSFQVVRIWKGEAVSCQGPEAIARMKAATSRDSFSEPFYSAIHRMAQDSSPVFMRQLQYWPTVPWDNRTGRVTLVGDAAQCMLPNRGQGLNQALDDVDCIVAQISRMKEEGASIGEALGNYETDVFARGKKAALESLEDANAVMATRDFGNSRQATQGLAK